MQSMWIQFREFRDNMYYVLNGRGVRAFHKDGNLHVVIEVAGKRWEATVPDLQKDTWYFLEYTWHPAKGLQIFVNNRLMASTEIPVTVEQGQPSEDSLVLIGNANTADSDSERTFSADGVVDQVEIWYRDRDNLIAFDHILRGQLYSAQVCLALHAIDYITHCLLRDFLTESIGTLGFNFVSLVLCLFKSNQIRSAVY